MAPILKDGETAVTTATSAPASPAPKSPAEATRPQPVALEIPVTINGAHTVAGSAKREPFSETTQTVLVFAHGAVVRVTTALAPGQLVFLTNEKTKKEVVCQVLKSKAGGSTNNNYVELQFTEPAPSFWGLRTPAGPAAPAPLVPVSTPASRPVASTAPPAAMPLKPVAPAVPPPPKPVAVTPKPPAPPTPLVSVPPPSPLPGASEPPRVQAAPLAPPKPVVAPPPPPSAAIPVPLAAATPPVPPVSTAPLISVPPPSPLSASPASPRVQAPPSPPPVPQSRPVPEPTPASLTLAAPQNPPAPEKHSSAIPAPPLRDYSKEIEALFSPPSSPARSASGAPPEPHVVPPAPATPSTDQLKLEAARLQAQLSSMLFTETPAPSHAASPAAPPKTELPVVDAAKKVFEIAQEPPKPAAPPKLPESKLVPPPGPPKPVSLSAEDEEVKIPSWLAPLSQSTSWLSASETTPPLATEPEPEIATLPEESSSIESASQTQPTPAFGEQWLADSTPEAEAADSGSKKALWIGIAAAALFVLGAVGYFLRPRLFGAAPAASAKPAPVDTNAPLAAAPAAPPAVETTPAASAPESVNSAPAPSAPAPLVSQPARNPQPVSSPAVSAPPAEPKASASRNTPAPEPIKKPPLGKIHLAAPVVSRESNAQPGSAALPAIDPTSNSNSGTDALAAVASSHHAAPTAPLPVGGEVTPAQLVRSVSPIYPPVAKAQHITGNVTIDCLIDANGNVADLRVVSGPPLLHRAATDAVKQWKYKPAVLDGQPTSMRVTVTVQFRTQ